MAVIRHSHELGEKEIAFKDFGMGQLQRALPDYLRALDNLAPGFLFTLAVDKRIETLIGPTKNDLMQILVKEEIGEWKPKTVEKLLRIVHILAFFAALFTRDGQKIFWMTDHDDICPNTEMHQNALQLFQRVLKIYTRPDFICPLIGGALPFQERSIEILDLLSATDVASSTVGHYLSKRGATSTGETVNVKPGSDLVLRWLLTDGPVLKKLNMIMYPNKDGLIERGVLRLK